MIKKPLTLTTISEQERIALTILLNAAYELYSLVDGEKVTFADWLKVLSDGLYETIQIHQERDRS